MRQRHGNKSLRNWKGSKRIQR